MFEEQFWSISDWKRSVNFVILELEQFGEACCDDAILVSVFRRVQE